MTNPDDIARIAKGLSMEEILLITGRADKWGSWMSSCASGLTVKGLYAKSCGSYTLTPTGLAVRQYLMERVKG